MAGWSCVVRAWWAESLKLSHSTQIVEHLPQMFMGSLWDCAYAADESCGTLVRFKAGPSEANLVLQQNLTLEYGDMTNHSVEARPKRVT